MEPQDQAGTRVPDTERLPRPESGRASGAATERFLRCERASVALESALALAVLVGGFAGLVHIVGDIFAEDRAGRGARAAAHALALDPGADPWAALVREGGLDTSAACPEWAATDTTADCGGWTLTVHRGVSPAELASALGGTATAGGEMVLVHVERTQPQATRNAETPSTPGGLTRVAAIGVARSEPGG